MRLPEAYRLDKRRLTAGFNRAAAGYEDAAVLQRTVADRMVQRLDLIRLHPASLLDAGAGTGHAARLLGKRYRDARLLVLDIAHNMLLQARRRAPRFFSRQLFVAADLESLPVASESMDMIFSNLALQWCNDLDGAFREFKRALKANGLVMFSTFGPDTLKELRTAWAAVDDRTHVHAFFDMHDVGDALIRAGFGSPVLDVERFTLTYQDVFGLMRDLKNLGAMNVTLGRCRGLTGKSRMSELKQGYEGYRRDGVLPATYEVVYGHAWAPEQRSRPQDGSTVAAFPLVRLRHSKTGAPLRAQKNRRERRESKAQRARNAAIVTCSRFIHQLSDHDGTG